jgi:hypothetical protein
MSTVTRRCYQMITVATSEDVMLFKPIATKKQIRSIATETFYSSESIMFFFIKCFKALKDCDVSLSQKKNESLKS